MTGKRYLFIDSYKIVLLTHSDNFSLKRCNDKEREYPKKTSRSFTNLNRGLSCS